jgi:hypothetical protein
MRSGLTKKRPWRMLIGAAKAPVVPNRQCIDYRYNERVTGLTRAGYMILVKGSALRSLLFIMAAARD